MSARRRINNARLLFFFLSPLDLLSLIGLGRAKKTQRMPELVTLKERAQESGGKRYKSVNSGYNFTPNNSQDVIKQGFWVTRCCRSTALD